MRNTFLLLFVLTLVGCGGQPALKPGPSITAQEVLSLALAPDGKTLAIGSNDKSLRLIETFSGREVKGLTGHTSGVWALAFSNDGRWLASAASDSSIRVWEVDTGKQVRVLNPGGYSVAFSPDGKTLAVGSDYVVRTYATDSWKLQKELKDPDGNVFAVAISPDGKTLASGSSKALKVWDLASARQVSTHTESNCAVRSVAFFDDDTVVTYYRGHGVTRVRAHDGTVRDDHAENGDVGLSSNGHQALAAEPNLATLLKEVDTWKTVASIKLPLGTVSAVALSPDGKVGAVAGIKEVHLVTKP